MSTELWRVPAKLLFKVQEAEWRDFVMREADRNELFRGKLLRWLYRFFDEPELTEEAYVDRVQKLFTYCVEETPRCIQKRFGKLTRLCMKFVDEEMVELTKKMMRLPKPERAKILKTAVIEFFTRVTDHANLDFVLSGYKVLRPAYAACSDLLEYWISMPEVSKEERRSMLMNEMQRVCKFYIYRRTKVYDMAALRARLITAAGLTPEDVEPAPES